MTAMKLSLYPRPVVAPCSGTRRGALPRLWPAARPGRSRRGSTVLIGGNTSSIVLAMIVTAVAVIGQPHAKMACEPF